MTDSTAPRFIKCPVCDGEDTLNVNVAALDYATDLCSRCNTDIHSDESFFGPDETCPICKKDRCYCDGREEWRKVLACQHAYVEENNPDLKEYSVKQCPKCKHYQMRRK